MFKLHPVPWNDPKVKVRVKTNAYFHEKHEIWNSLAHSSPKIAKFYLKYQQNFKNHVQTDSIPSENRSKNTISRPTPTQVINSPNDMKRSCSREQIKRRQLEREALQARSSQCISSLNLQEFNPRFSTYRDPAAPPVICKAKTFDNYNELPGSRLKLVVNDFIMERDKEALKYMEKKIIEEVQEEQVKKVWHVDNRTETLARMGRVRKMNKNKEEKAGVKKQKSDADRKNACTSDRLQRLSVAKEPKVGMPVDYNESFGLIRAGVLLSEKAKFPKSARQPMVKRVDSHNLSEFTFNSFEGKPVLVEEYDTISQQEIYEQMNELDVFEKKIGQKKERLGFPHIDLEKFKNKIL